MGILPKWLSKALQSLTFFKTYVQAYNDLGSYLRVFISRAGRDETENQAHNLLAGLVRSRREETGKTDTTRREPGLSDDEILGNLYIFMLAGHETTASVLQYTFVLLALHPEVQDELYHEIQQVIYDEGDDMGNWNYARVYPRLLTALCITVRLHSRSLQTEGKH